MENLFEGKTILYILNLETLLTKGKPVYITWKPYSLRTKPVLYPSLSGNLSLKGQARKDTPTCRTGNLAHQDKTSDNNR